jgi:hypothetical protein
MILRAGSPLLDHPEARRNPATFVSEPILKAVSDCDISQDETLPFDLASFVTAFAVSALG